MATPYPEMLSRKYGTLIVRHTQQQDLLLVKNEGWYRECEPIRRHGAIFRNQESSVC